MKDKILVVDVEATSVNPKEAVLLELGAVVLNTKTGKIRKAFSATFRNHKLRKKDREAWIFQNSSMTVEEIRNSLPLDDYREQIQSLFDTYRDCIVAWNRPYDATILELEGFTLGSPMRDPMRESKDYIGAKNKSGRIKWANVEEAVEMLGIEKDFKEKHRGLDDARMEAKIIYELIKRGVYEC